MSEQRYGPLADRTARRYGIPPELFRRLITQESGWRPGAVSSAGARGLTQIVPRWHPDADLSTPQGQLDAGARYLAAGYREFHDWRLALAAYNAGPNAVRRAGGVPNFTETQNYVRAILAGDKTFPGLGEAPSTPAPAGTRVRSADFGEAPTTPVATELSPAGRRILQGYLTRSRQAVLAGTELDRWRDMGLEDALAQLQRLPRTPAPPDPGAWSPPGAPGPTPAGPSSPQASGRLLGAVGTVIGHPGQGTHTLGNWQSDRALDIRVPVGTPVYAWEAGTIGSQFGSLGSSGRYQGLRLTLQGPSDAYWYGHLSRYAPGIRPGARVTAGQLLGYTGSANNVPHLHIGRQYGDPLELYR